MSRVRADVTALRQNATQIQKQISELDAMNSSLESLLSNIEATWEGAASEQYIETMRKHKLKAESMRKILTEFKYYIEQAASKFEEQDHSGASRIRSC